MGGRGSSSGISVKGKPYGSEYTTLYKSGNIKFVRHNSGSATAPMETMTKGRVYVTVDDKNNLKAITYHDTENKRNKQIDLDKPHQGMKPHTHHGYFHNENDSSRGAANLTAEERRMIDKVKEIWYNNYNK